ncbi:MAG: hypothetical protein XU12_C0009G0067 [Deltaproteobacteria bacterium CSP1-8]|nr:MAG: hypothetical protein XU12_C0009G0067 [Deltaproteobacteria bacterium CSP1-8]
MSPRIPSILIAVVLALPLLSSDAMPAQGKGPEKMELYTAGDNTFALYKPPGWKVDSRAVENGKVVTVSDPKGGSRAVMRILSMQDRRENSTTLVSRTLKDLRATVSGLDLAWARSTEDRRRAVIEFRYTGNQKNPMRGRYYFNTQYPDATVFGYEATEKEFGKQKSLLLSVLANFTILDPSAASGQFGASSPRKNAPDLQMTKTVSGDRSFSLLVPKGWKLEGAKGQALCTTPGDGIAGFIASTISFWGPSRVPYFDSSRIRGVIHSPYCRPVDALILAMRESGSRNHKVLERATDPARAGKTAAYLKRGADVETASLSFDSRTGVRCKGVFDVTAFHPLPSGQWGITVTGIWSPEKEIAEYLPSLLRMAESYHINEQFAEDYVRRGLENLRRMTRETSEKAARAAREIRESSMAAYQERQRSMEYIDYKRTGYIRGEQEWLSQAEGGALYKSDHWGLSREGERDIEGQDYNYYNYKGKNPRYNETMTPVDISREVYESVYGK